MPTPKTIQIYLPDGEPQGLRTAEMTTRIVQVIDVPRKLLPQFRAMPESQQVGVYYLVGETEAGEPLVYVGQTGDLNGRLVSHNRNKDFWRRVLVVISRTNTLTLTHGLYLEWRSIATVREAGRYTDENGTAGGEPFTMPPLRAECDEFFETIGPLVATLGHPLFDPVVRRQPNQSSVGDLAEVGNEDLGENFYCRSSEADASGQYTSEGFVVLKGSSGRADVVASLKGTQKERRRQDLVDSGVAVIKGDRFVFVKDHLFDSPSSAAVAVQARGANGWTEWKDETGRTLKEVKRDEDGSGEP